MAISDLGLRLLCMRCRAVLDPCCLPRPAALKGIALPLEGAPREGAALPGERSAVPMMWSIPLPLLLALLCRALSDSLSSDAACDT